MAHVVVILIIIRINNNIFVRSLVWLFQCSSFISVWVNGSVPLHGWWIRFQVRSNDKNNSSYSVRTHLRLFWSRQCARYSLLTIDQYGEHHASHPSSVISVVHARTNLSRMCRNDKLKMRCLYKKKKKYLFCFCFGFSCSPRYVRSFSIVLMVAGWVSEWVSVCLLFIVHRRRIYLYTNL